MTDKIKITRFDIDDSKISWPLYQENWRAAPRTITNIGAIINQDIKEALENMAEEYMKYLNIPQLPVRIDLWIDNNNMLIPFEINTGFVDQIWSGLNILEATNQKTEIKRVLESLKKSRKRSKIVVTLPEYIQEVKLMMKYLKDIWINTEIINIEDALASQEEIFCYWYPLDNMEWRSNIVPGKTWLDIESKRDFYSFLDQRIKNNENFAALLWYNQKSLNYERLPKDRDLIFKKDGPKVKWDRETVTFAKAKQNKSSENEYWYKFGQKIAQERLNTLNIKNTGDSIFQKDKVWFIKKEEIIDVSTFELRAILLANRETWKYELTTTYWLLWGSPENKALVNDSNPQWAVIVK